MDSGHFSLLVVNKCDKVKKINYWGEIHFLRIPYYLVWSRLQSPKEFYIYIPKKIW